MVFMARTSEGGPMPDSFVVFIGNFFCLFGVRNGLVGRLGAGVAVHINVVFTSSTSCCHNGLVVRVGKGGGGGGCRVGFCHVSPVSRNSQHEAGKSGKSPKFDHHGSTASPVKRHHCLALLAPKVVIVAFSPATSHTKPPSSKKKANRNSQKQNKHPIIRLLI